MTDKSSLTCILLQIKKPLWPSPNVRPWDAIMLDDDPPVRLPAIRTTGMRKTWVSKDGTQSELLPFQCAERSTSGIKQRSLRLGCKGAPQFSSTALNGGGELHQYRVSAVRMPGNFTARNSQG